MARFSGKKSFVQIFVAGAIVLLLTGVGLTGVLVFSLSPPRLKVTLERAVRQAWGAELKITSLHYSSFFPVRVELAGISLEDAGGVEMLMAPSAVASVPLQSLFEARPELSLVIQQPSVRIERRSDSAWNWSRQVGNSNPPTVTIPLVFAKARLSVELREGSLLVRGPSHTDFGWSGLHAKFQGDQIPGPVVFEISGLPKGVGSPDSVWGGAAVLKGKLIPTPAVSHGSAPIAAIAFQADLDLTDAEFKFPEWKIAKALGMRLKVETTGNVAGARWNVDQVLVKLPFGEVRGSGELRAGNHVEARFRSSGLDVAKYADLFASVPPGSTGNLTIASEIRGPLTNLEYTATIQLRGLTGTWPGFTVKPVIEADAEIRNDRVETLVASLKAPGNDLTLNGVVDSISGRVAHLDLIAREADLDRMLSAPESPFSAALSYLGDLGISGSLGVQASAATVQGARFEQVKGKVLFRDGSFVGYGFTARSGGEGVLKGSIASNQGTKKGTVQLEVKKWEIAQLQKLLGLPEGFGGLLNGTAEFTSAEAAPGQWKGAGGFQVSAPKLGVLDPGLSAGQAMVEVLKARGNKKGAGQIKFPTVSNYGSLVANFELDSANQRLTIREIRTSQPKGAVMDLEGELAIQLGDGKVLNHRITMVDRRDISGARRHLRELVAADDQRIRIPIDLGCTITKPCLSFAHLANPPQAAAAAAVVRPQQGPSAVEGVPERDDQEDYDNLLLLQDAMKSRSNSENYQLEEQRP